VNRDLVFGACGAIVAAGYYGLAVSIPRSALADAVGPQGLPTVYAFVLLFLSLILIVRALRTSQQESKTAFHFGRVAGMLAMGVAYLLIVPWLGYVATLAGLILATTWYQTRVMTKTTVVVAVAGAMVFWLVFVVLLGIPQPPGIWAQRF